MRPKFRNETRSLTKIAAEQRQPFWRAHAHCPRLFRLICDQFSAFIWSTWQIFHVRLYVLCALCRFAVFSTTRQSAAYRDCNHTIKAHRSKRSVPCDIKSELRQRKLLDTVRAIEKTSNEMNHCNAEHNVKMRWQLISVNWLRELYTLLIGPVQNEKSK